MFKKLIAILLLMLFILTCVSINAIAVTDSPCYELVDISARKDEVFEMPILIKNNPGIISLRLSIVYDSEVLELTEIVNVGSLNGYTSPSPTVASPYILRWSDALATYDNTTNGSIAILKFKMLKETETSVSIQHKEARNYYGAKISFENVTGKVGVTENTEPEIDIVDGSTAIIDENGFISGINECSTDINEYLKVENGTIEYEFSNDYEQLGTGTVVNVFDSEGNHFASYTIVIFGDYNGDGVADSEDTTYFSAIANFEIFDYFDYEHLFMAADVNGDGVVDAMDEDDMNAVANFEAYIDHTITDGSKVVRY